MKKFLLGLLSGFLLAGLAFVIAMFAFARFGSSRPSTPSNAALVLRLGGDIPEIAPVDVPFPGLMGPGPLTMIEVWDLLRKAASDSRVKALILEPRFLGVGWGKAQQLRESLMLFRKSGKPIYAHLESARAKEYYLATAADKIYLAPEDFLDVKGLRAEVSHYRQTWAKAGIEWEMEHAGKYKDAMDSYTRDSMTPETREALGAVLDDLHGHLVDSFAAGRNKTPASMRELIDQGPFLGKAAVAKGMVDGQKFPDEVFDELKKSLGRDNLEKMSHREYARVPHASAGIKVGSTRIALLSGQGEILRGGQDSSAGDEMIRSGAFGKLVRKVAADSSIKGVILRIDSPGGDAIASEEILHELRKLSKKKPMVISMSDVAASGGYYMAMTGDPVVAYPATFTGSIGVIFGKVNLRGLYDKLGIKTEVLTRGRNADIDSLIRPMDATARAKLKEGIDDTYQTFLTRVAEGRKREVASIAPLAEGRVWLGAQAKKNGLVDELGGLDRALELLKSRMKVDAKERVRIIPFPGRRTVFDELFGDDDAENPLDRAARTRVRELVRTAGIHWFEPELWQRGGMLAIAPYSLSVR